MSAVSAGQRPLRAVLIGAAMFALLLGLLLAGDKALGWYYDPARGNPDNAVVLLTTRWCKYCAIMRYSLQQSNIPFKEIDIEASNQGRWAFRASGARGIPVTLIGQQYVSGGLGSQFKALHAAGYPARVSIPDELKPGR